jgi:hypothetical protein
VVKSANPALWFVLGNYWFWWLAREDSCNQAGLYKLENAVDP